MWQCVDCETRNDTERARCMVCGAAPPPPGTASIPVRFPDPTPVEVFPSAPRPVRASRSPRFTAAAAPRRRRFRPVWTIAAALLAIPVAIAAVAHLGPSRPVGSNTSDTVTTTAAATEATAEQQARALAALIQTSSKSRAAVKNAVIATKACRSLSANAETFTDAASARRSQRDRAGALDVAAVASGAELTDTLVRALDYSEQADNAFAAWATELDGRGCQVGDTVTGNFKEGDRESNSATAEKKHFVAVWNPVAGSYGLPQFVYSDV